MSEPYPILIGEHWEHETTESFFSPLNPSTGELIGDVYPISSRETLAQLATLGANAAIELNQCEPTQIAAFLHTHAELIDAKRRLIAQLAHEETGLDVSPRLRDVEMDRTLDQLHQTASCVADGSWTTPRIDIDLNLRSMYEPLGGAVLTIGPNNFPLAYNAVAGGDFAAAIAARNPVIAKAHPLHPGTTRLLAECAHTAAKQTQLPPSSVQMFYHCQPEDGLELVRMSEISAVGFTGSRIAGLALKQAADSTGTLISLELSSINPVFILQNAMQSRGQEIADMVAGSMLAASGQQCTCPGLVIVEHSTETSMFISKLRDHLIQADPQIMLSRAGVEHLHESITHLNDAGASVVCGGNPIEGTSARHEHTLLRVNAETFIQNYSTLQTEMFGVAALIVVCDAPEQMIAITRLLEGNLTGTIHHDPDDRTQLDVLSKFLRPRVGRLIHNAVPTGVSVNAATVHGGPYPSTGHPGFTAVGMPTTIHRFAALRCYDRVDQQSLPPALRDPRNKLSPP